MTGRGPGGPSKANTNKRHEIESAKLIPQERKLLYYQTPRKNTQGMTDFESRVDAASSIWGYIQGLEASPCRPRNYHKNLVVKKSGGYHLDRMTKAVITNIETNQHHAPLPMIHWGLTPLTELLPKRRTWIYSWGNVSKPKLQGVLQSTWNVLFKYFSQETISSNLYGQNAHSQVRSQTEENQQ